MQTEAYSLDLKFLRGQGYDGVGNMAGKCRGASALITEDYPKALYFHCTVHILILCVVRACKVQSVQNMHDRRFEGSQFLLFYKFTKEAATTGTTN